METSNISPPTPEYIIQSTHDFMIVSASNERIATASIVYMQNGTLLLTSVWVHHEHRRKGLATALIDQVLQIYGDRTVWLNVHPYTNIPMGYQKLVKFYESFGWTLQTASGAMVRHGYGPTADGT